MHKKTSRKWCISIHFVIIVNIALVEGFDSFLNNNHRNINQHDNHKSLLPSVVSNTTHSPYGYSNRHRGGSTDLGRNDYLHHRERDWTLPPSMSRGRAGISR